MRHRGKVNHVDFSPNGAGLVTASADRTARVWDIRTGVAVTPPLPHDGSVNRATFSPDGLRVVTASADKNARVWDAASGKLLAPPLAHQEEVYWAAWNSDGERIVTASEDRAAGYGMPGLASRLPRRCHMSAAPTRRSSALAAGG